MNNFLYPPVPLMIMKTKCHSSAVNIISNKHSSQQFVTIVSTYNISVLRLLNENVLKLQSCLNMYFILFNEELKILIRLR